MSESFEERFEQGYEPVTESGCWIWTKATSSAGYGQIYKDGRVQYAHRLSYEMHFGEIPKGLMVCHKCDNPACINPAHLFIGTNADNMADMVKKDRSNRKGESNPANKLTKEQVLSIRQDSRTTQAIANDYGVVRHTIGDIKRGKIWGWL